MADNFAADRKANSAYTRWNIELPVVPATVKDGEFALPVQRALIPATGAGLIPLVMLEGSVALAYVLKPLKDRLDELEIAVLGALTEESDPVATKQIASLKATVDALPIDSVKASVKSVQDQYAALDTAKADQADLDAANAAIKALQDAIAALPTSGSATPAQLQAIEDRTKALENAINRAENSKGILQFDARSHALIAGNLFGGFRRLTESDVTGINERAGYASTKPYAALNGSGQTDMSNASNQWLTWNFDQVRLWRVEITFTNGNWAIRYLKRNAVKVKDLSRFSGTYTDIYIPGAASGNELANSLQLVDDGGDTRITNLYVSVTDSANPALAPTINGIQLKAGDRFRLNNGDLSTLFAYQGTDAATGAWKATPLSSVSDSNICLHTQIDPIIDQHLRAIESLEVKNVEQETLILDLTTRLTALEGLLIKVSGLPTDGDWLLALSQVKTADKKTTRLYGQFNRGEAIPLTFREDAIAAPTHSTAQLQPDGSYRQDLGAVKLNYKTTLNLQNEQEMTLTFAAMSLTRVDFEGQDAAGVALELGGVAIAPTATSLSLNPGCSNALVTQILWKITYKDGSTIDYLVPLTR